MSIEGVGGRRELHAQKQLHLCKCGKKAREIKKLRKLYKRFLCNCYCVTFQQERKIDKGLFRRGHSCPLSKSDQQFLTCFARFVASVAGSFVLTREGHAHAQLEKCTDLNSINSHFLDPTKCESKTGGFPLPVS